MESAREDIEFSTGDAYVEVWRFEDIDLTSATLKAQVRDAKSGQKVADFTIVDAEARTETVTRATFIVSADDTAELVPGRAYVYDVQFTISGVPQALVRGNVNVVKGITA